MSPQHSPPRVVRFPDGRTATQYKRGSSAWFTSSGSTIATGEIPLRSRELVDGHDWKPGDPIYADERDTGRQHCGPCLTSWTADVDRCPECDELSTEALRAEILHLQDQR
jgi:hypothetical protein